MEFYSCMGHFFLLFDNNYALENGQNIIFGVVQIRQNNVSSLFFNILQYILQYC
jgi:hypothetical protein